MPMISVKTAEGRIARESSRGPFIPNDRYVPVSDSAYLQRRIEDGDVILEKAKSEEPAEKVQPPVTPNPTAIKA